MPPFGRNYRIIKTGAKSPVNTKPLNKPFQRVDALIDWNSQLLLVKHQSNHRNHTELSRLVLRYICRRISDCLAKVEPTGQFEVHLRAYHGWSIGQQETWRRKAVINAQVSDPNDPNDRGLANYSSRNGVYFRSFEFGDKLLLALDERLHVRLGCHLPGTLRQIGDNYEEKMVDTALASDLVYLALTDTDSWLMVVGQDRDLIPPLYVAEAAISGTERRVFFLARHKINRPNIEGLQY